MPDRSLGAARTSGIEPVLDSISQRTFLPSLLHDYIHFYIIGNMKTKDALNAFAALAQDSRMTILKLLVRCATNVLTAGLIGEQLELAAPTLSFHLKTLAQAGLVNAVQEGRFVRYRAELATINALIEFLTEDCCGGNSQLCAPMRKRS